MEYFENGTISVTGPGLNGETMTVSGKYVFLGDNTLRLDMTVFGNIVSETVSLRIEENTLIVTDEKGKVGSW